MSQKLKSQTSTFEVEDPAQSPNTFVVVGGVRAINNLRSGTAAEIDVSDLQSTAKEFVLGLADNGSMDIKSKGVKIFRILEVIQEVPDKLYSGAIVNYPENLEKGLAGVIQKIMKSIRDLHQLLKVKKDFEKEDGDITSYDVAHHIGLSLQEEYELLGLFDEKQRQEYLKRHLTKVIPMLAGMEQLKEKIKGNGHFKNLSGFDLDK